MIDEGYFLYVVENQVFAVVPDTNDPHVFKALEKRVYGGSKTSAILHVCLHICKQGITYSKIRVLHKSNIFYDYCIGEQTFCKNKKPVFILNKRQLTLT